jgi:hypothetical protein
MTRQPRSTGKSEGTCSDKPGALDTDASGQDYRVGPGRPPKEFQFKPGQSGNPRGARRKPTSIAPDHKASLECALSKKVTLRQGEKNRILTMAAAGIEQLVAQFAKGDRHARRDLIMLAEKLGVNLVAGQADAIQQALVGAFSASDQALLSDYVKRHRSEGTPQHEPVETDTGPSEPHAKPRR